MDMDLNECKTDWDITSTFYSGILVYCGDRIS